MRHWKSGSLYLAVTCLYLVQIGCKKEDLQKMADTVKQATVEKLESVKPKPPPTGKVQVALDQPANAVSARAQLLVIGDGRPSILQIRSYTDPERETFPAILFQGPINATDISKVAGQTVKGKLFIQTGAAAPIWYTPDDQTVTVNIESVEETELVGAFSSGSLVSTQGRAIPVSGSFRAVAPALIPPPKTPAAPSKSSTKSNPTTGAKE